MSRSLLLLEIFVRKLSSNQTLGEKMYGFNDKDYQSIVSLLVSYNPYL
jgi:hypothetical protein